MSKAVLKFDLTDFDDRQEFERVIKATDMASVIWEYLRNSRKEIERKFESNEGFDSYDGIEACFEKFGEILEKNNINIDELYS